MSTVNFNPADRIDLRAAVADPKRARIRLMARSGGYVMVRKPACTPFVLTEKEWAKLPLFDDASVKAVADYSAALRDGRPSNAVPSHPERR